MFGIAILCVLLIGLCAFIHYEVLRLLNDRLTTLSGISRHLKVLVAVLGAAISHAVQIALFALAYFAVRNGADVQVLGGALPETFWTYLYFSTETYTTLGFGDIYPVQEVRMVAGAEALTGLLMISWTASFTYLEMSRYWQD